MSLSGPPSGRFIKGNFLDSFMDRIHYLMRTRLNDSQGREKKIKIRKFSNFLN